MAGHVINPSTKFEDPMSIRSWVMSSDISHRIPLTGEGRSLAGKISGGRGPHFEEVGYGVEPWSMARWKALVLGKRNWTSFSISYGWGAARQNVLKLAVFRRGRSLGAKISGGKGSFPCQHIDTTRKAIDCATSLPLSVFIQWNFAADFPALSGFSPLRGLR